MKSHIATGLALSFVLLLSADSAWASKWVKDKHGCKFLDVTQNGNVPLLWHGKCQGGYASGHGMLESFKDGKWLERIDVAMNQGIATGKGIFNDSDGTRGEIEFVSGEIRKFSGTYANGRQIEFEGDFQGEFTGNSHMSGKMSATWPNGTHVVFEGDYINGEPNNCKADVTFPNGTHYHGEFAGGKLSSGKMTGILRNGTPFDFEGTLVDNKPNDGKMVLTLPDGSHIEENFRGGVVSHDAVQTWPNGDHYNGGLVAGKKTGNGTFVWANNERFEGTYDDDKPMNGKKYDANGQIISVYLNGEEQVQK